MNDSQKRVLSIFCFIIAGFLLFHILLNSYKNYQEAFDLYQPYENPPHYDLDSVIEIIENMRFYIAIILIGLGIFFRKGLKEENKKDNPKLWSALSLISAGVILIYLFLDIYRYWPTSNMNDPWIFSIDYFFDDMRSYLAISLIALGMFIRARFKEKENRKILNDTQKKKVISILSILCFIVGLIFSFSPFWDSYKDYRFAYGIYKSHQEQEAKKPIREEEHSVPTDELSKRIDELFRKEWLEKPSYSFSDAFSNAFDDERFYFGITLVLLGAGIFIWKRAIRGKK